MNTDPTQQTVRFTQKLVAGGSFCRDGAAWAQCGPQPSCCPSDQQLPGWSPRLPKDYCYRFPNISAQRC